MLDRRAVLGGFAAAAATALPARAADGGPYLFSYFPDANEAAGLCLAWSEDGLGFTALRNGDVFLKPQVGVNKLFRDPCLFKAPGAGEPWHMVWTTDWNGPVIGHATSHDLVNWSAQQAIPVMKDFPRVRNSWAPEGFWDPRNNEFVIFWSSTVEGMFPDASGKSEDNYAHRIFFTRTRDFKTFTPTKLFFDPGYSVIDGTLLQGPDGKLSLLFKDERLEPLKKHIRIATAQTPAGPFTVQPTILTEAWLEGPTGIWTGSEYRVYADFYRKPQAMHLYRSTDLVHWTQQTISTPRGMRHGTVIKAAPELLAALKKL